MQDEINTIHATPVSQPKTRAGGFWALSACLVLLGFAIILLGFYREYTLIVDDIPYSYKTIAFRGSTLLKNAGLDIQEADQVSLNPNAFSLQLPSLIRVNRARQVEIHQPSHTQTLNSAARHPATLLQEAGIRFYPNDLVLQNGIPIDPYAPLDLGQELILEYQPASFIILNDNGKQKTFSSQKETLAEAFSEQNIHLNEHDRLSIPLTSALSAMNEISIIRARKITASLDGYTFTGNSAADNPEEALLEIGLPLQNLDQVSQESNANFQNANEDIVLDIIRINESYELVKEETPYSNTYELDPNAELDTTSILVPGQTGYVITRTISITENGETVKTFPSQHWKASDPIDGVMGRGTMPVIKTETVDGIALEYWRKVSVYATSYHPSEFSPGARTRSGAPIAKGIIAVSAAWYPAMAGQQVYVPGYGHAVVGDSGGGIPGRYWIDLAYDDESYVGWHHWTTLYFLPPIPAYIPAVLP